MITKLSLFKSFAHSIFLYNDQKHNDSDEYDNEKDDVQVIIFTECERGGGLSFVWKSKIEGQVFGKGVHHTKKSCFYGHFSYPPYL